VEVTHWNESVCTKIVCNYIILSWGWLKNEPKYVSGLIIIKVVLLTVLVCTRITAWFLMSCYIQPFWIKWIIYYLSLSMISLYVYLTYI